MVLTYVNVRRGTCCLPTSAHVMVNYSCYMSVHSQLSLYHFDMHHPVFGISFLLHSASLIPITPFTLVSFHSSPVSIQMQSLALRALRKRKLQETQALALASSQSWISRNKRKHQPIGMLGRSSGNHDWLLANASACVSCGFRLRNARNASDCVWMETGLQPCSPLPSSPLSLSITPTVFHSRLKIYLFQKSFSLQTSPHPSDYLHGLRLLNGFLLYFFRLHFSPAPVVY